MQTIIFATTNENKLKEAKKILTSVKIEGAELPIEEIQSLDTKKVAVEKARAYFKELQKPLFIEDVALTFNALNGLPGTYINDFSKALGNDGLIGLLNGKSDRSAVALTTLVYIDENGEQIFEGEVKGRISESARGTNGFGWDPIFIPEGEDRTFAEIKDEEKNKYSMRAMALLKLQEYLSELS